MSGSSAIDPQVFHMIQVPLLLFLVLLAIILAAQEVGYRLGRRRTTRVTGDQVKGLGALEGAIYGLMGLLVAFTFSGASARFDARRQLVVEECNSIGTAWLRLDLLPPAVQPQIRDSFRRYVDARLDYYRARPDGPAALEAAVRAKSLQMQIWTEAVAAERQSFPAAGILVLPALNQMIDITTTRDGARHIHPPPPIFWMLAAAVVACALLGGWNMAAGGRKSWLHLSAFAFLMTLTVYVILDLEYPRAGVLRVDAFDRYLVEVRASMK